MDKKKRTVGVQNRTTMKQPWPGWHSCRDVFIEFITDWCVADEGEFGDTVLNTHNIQNSV